MIAKLLGQSHGCEVCRGRHTMKISKIIGMIGLALVAPATIALAHPGGLNSEGCHNDRKNGGHHCHRAPTTRPPTPANATPKTLVPDPSKGAPVPVYFTNCAAARAAGKAPVRIGQPGYGKHLDRDGDGVGCE